MMCINLELKYILRIIPHIVRFSFAIISLFQDQVNILLSSHIKFLSIQSLKFLIKYKIMTKAEYTFILILIIISQFRDQVDRLSLFHIKFLFRMS